MTLQSILKSMFLDDIIYLRKDGIDYVAQSNKVYERLTHIAVDISLENLLDDDWEILKTPEPDEKSIQYQLDKSIQYQLFMSANGESFDRIERTDGPFKIPDES